jgi:chromate transporter
MVAVVALAAALALAWWHVPQAELIVLGAGAVAGVLRYGKSNSTPMETGTLPSTDEAKMGAKALPLALAPLSVGVGFSGQLLQMTLFFLKVGATLFGSGYVLASFLHGGLVERYRWLTERELLDAIAVGQVTPGPLLTAATFIGYVLGARNFGGGVGGGVLAGVLATVGIFLPAFVFICVLGPVLPRLRRSPWARGALDGMNAAVVALILVVTLTFAGSVLLKGDRLATFPTAVFAVSLTLMLATKVNPTWLILAAGAVGVAIHTVP